MVGREVKIRIAIALFAVAAAILIIQLVVRCATRDVSELADDPQMLDFICAKCGHHFQLTYDEMEEAVEAAGPQTPTTSPVARGRRSPEWRPSMIKCPKCGELAAVSAGYCARHNTYYPAVNPDGTRGRCGECRRAASQPSPTQPGTGQGLENRDGTNGGDSGGS